MEFRLRGLKMARYLTSIARDIRADWERPYFGAIPYLNAMSQLDSIRDNFGFDSGESIVRYFLNNAKTWRGPIAREIKAELKSILEGK